VRYPSTPTAVAVPMRRGGRHDAHLVVWRGMRARAEGVSAAVRAWMQQE
jgi:hypothetical protein